jgi:hypothetical protein
MTSISDTNVVNAPGGLVELGFAIAPASTTVTATSIGSAHQLGSVTFVSDGSPILVEFSAGVVSPPTANSSLIFVALEVDGSTTNRIYWISFRNSASAGNYLDQSAYAQERLVLSAGVHTIRTLAWCSGGTNGVVHSGGNYSPAITRVSKIIQASQLIVQTPNAPLVTSLPSNAIDGQEVRYLADDTNGIVWNFRYRAGSSSTYKWEFIGGIPISTQHNNGTQYTLTHAAGTYSDVLTKAIPLAGDYLINGACLLTTTSGNDAIICINTTASRNINYYVARMSNGASQYENGNRTVVLTALAANATIALSDYHVAQGSGSTVGNANLVITPIRVSA